MSAHGNIKEQFELTQVHTAHNRLSSRRLLGRGFAEDAYRKACRDKPDGRPRRILGVKDRSGVIFFRNT
jgi:hypothetical protein